VDTGIWVALIDAADPLHGRAVALIEGYRSFPLFSNDMVLSETVTLFCRELGPEVAARFGCDFLDGKFGTLVSTERADWVQAFALIEAYREQTLSAADAASMAVVRRLDLEKVASFDRHFRIVLTEREVLGQQ
jgi:predicted nucleic acid-binding protein